MEAMFCASTTGSQVLILLQMNEWSVMVYMIMYQNGKKMGEIVHDMSNKETRDVYRRKERSIMLLFQFLILFNVFENAAILLAWTDLISYKKYFNKIDNI